jgi:hypothetical protein
VTRRQAQQKKSPGGQRPTPGRKSVFKGLFAKPKIVIYGSEIVNDLPNPDD